MLQEGMAGGTDGQGRENLTSTLCWGALLSSGLPLDRQVKTHRQFLVHLPAPGARLPGDTPSPASPGTLQKMGISSGTQSCSRAGGLRGTRGCLKHCCAKGEGLPLCQGSSRVVPGSCCSTTTTRLGPPGGFLHLRDHPGKSPAASGCILRLFAAPGDTRAAPQGRDLLALTCCFADDAESH